VDLGRFFSFIIYTHSDGLLGRGIRSSQGGYLHTEQHKHGINEYRHSCLEWHSNPRSQCTSGRRRCDRHLSFLLRFNYPAFDWFSGPQILHSVRIECVRLTNEPSCITYMPISNYVIDTVFRLFRIRFLIHYLTSAHVDSWCVFRTLSTTPFHFPLKLSSHIYMFFAVASYRHTELPLFL
jgi:hypothetical protein